jgi:hypothetical protein
MKILWMLAAMTAAFGQTAAVTNLDTAKWVKDKESESVLLQTDPATGGMDMLVRFPGGHVIPPHCWRAR